MSASMYISRKVKNIIMIGVVVIALIIAFDKSKIINAFLKPSDIMGNTPKKAEEIFQQSQYDTKIELHFVTQDLNKIKREIDDIIIENELHTIYSKTASNNITKLVKIPRDKYKEIISSLRAFEQLQSDELVQSTQTATVEALKKRINDEERVKEKILSDLAQTRSVYETESLQENLKRQNNTLDSLRQTLSATEQQINNVLAKIDVSHFISRGDVIEYAFKTFVITFVLSFLFISVALLIIYFAILLFGKVFNILGIKTVSGKPSRYGSSHYGYGYDYGAKKKIKRKYIRKPSQKEGEESERLEKSDQDKEK